MPDKKPERTDTAKAQALAQLQNIREMVNALNKAKSAEDDEAIDQAREAIREDALSVDVRSGWQSVGDRHTVEEYRILLCTGGPAVQIKGDLDRWNQPHTARLQYQDWFTPWIDLEISSEDEATMLEYCNQFYFGEKLP